MKKAAYAIVAAGAAIAALFVINMVASDTTGSARQGFVFHALLWEEEYVDGVHERTFDIAAGTYTFRFVPNGDSPRVLSISMEGKSFSFADDFALDGTLHKSPISEYYTWDYQGQKTFEVPDGQSVDITIDPNGNVIGTVSVMIGAAP